MKLNDVLAGLVVIAAMVGLQVLVFINGWGMEPQSWWWIIGVGVFGTVFMRLVGDKVLKVGES